MTLRRLSWLFVALFALSLVPAHAATPTVLAAEQAARSGTLRYTLPPATMQKAIALHRQGIVLYLLSPALSLAILLLLLSTGYFRRVRGLAAGVRTRWLQGVFFLVGMQVSVSVLKLPLSLYGHHLGLYYGLSVQGWASWFADWAKSLGLTTALVVLVGLGVYALIRRFPRTWWLWLWVAMLPCIVFLVFVAPVFLDPIFNEFEPLQNSNPALVAQLEKVVQRSGVAIPPERMFLMKASAKVTGLNAYVTGVGASKRVVVWDTTIARATPDEIAFIFGHETGHYVMQHLWLGMAATALITLLLLPVGVWAERALLRRYGVRWGIASEADWGSAPVLLLVTVVLMFLSDPAGNSISRRMEHNADIYGQEVVHGIVADPQQVGVHSFQVLGETSLDDPRPHPLEEFWIDGHPPIWFRTNFAAVYDPWKPGETPQYFKK
ncbi:M48 family metalloprotease [Terriglobus tenax]|uniref:M48 family metalloprotease n=1 Tax=Terriglobus tenax TaxID=1111115 RepID=UPI0021E042D1|nr:M48 family metalloprotease [Terriglobus tenax]